ncbi:MAG: NusA antitermination factor [candidate division TM6 bacterium GW2011_GWF2_38_10]|nr:MAG: NusA antitermination factor [candidate division TM6 bacterium GW2011_GWF2_38_10]
MNLSHVIEDLVEERGLDREKVISIVCDGIKTAYTKKFPYADFEVVYNNKSGNLDIFVRKLVASVVDDDDVDISFRKAKTIDPNCSIGDEILVPFEEQIGRIEILTAKQIISGKIRELEQMAVYNEFKDKQGTIISGMVHKRERAGFAVKLGDVMALLPQESMIPGEVLRVGYPVRALLKEVLSAPKGDYQLILDRASAEFVQCLLSAEIPEVFEGLVEIVKIVRIPGYKTKAIVSSSSAEVDPVGTCVGVGGARIKPILRELGQEKIDLIGWSESVEDLVKGSLKPADVERVELVGDKKAVVWFPQDQRSLAIGKMGQNIKLASRLVGLEIQLQDIAPAAAGVDSIVVEDEDGGNVDNDAD